MQLHPIHIERGITSKAKRYEKMSVTLLSEAQRLSLRARRSRPFDARLKLPSTWLDIEQPSAPTPNYLNYLARPERFEVPTPWFVG